MARRIGRRSVGGPAGAGDQLHRQPERAVRAARPRKDDCYVNWATPMSRLLLELHARHVVRPERKVTDRVNGFFQTSMYIPASLTGRGVRVPCGHRSTIRVRAPRRRCTMLKVGTRTPGRSGRSRPADCGRRTTARPPVRRSWERASSPCPCRVLDTRNTRAPARGPALQRARRAPSSSRPPRAAFPREPGPSRSTRRSRRHEQRVPDALPGDGATPVATSINFSPGKTRANNAVVALASDFSGKVKVRNGSTGTVHFILDVNGYFK